MFPWVYETAITGSLDHYLGGGGAMHFSKGGTAITYEKIQLSSPVAMGDNGHLQLWSRLPACIMAKEIKILETNLKFEEMLKFISYFCRF